MDAKGQTAIVTGAAQGLGAATARALAEAGAKVGIIDLKAEPLEVLAVEIGASAAPTVLYAGNLDAYQNLPFFEKVMTEVRDEEGDTRFLVATAAKGKVQGAEFIQTPDFDALRDALAQDSVFVCPRASWSGREPSIVTRPTARPAVSGERRGS